MSDCNRDTTTTTATTNVNDSPPTAAATPTTTTAIEERILHRQSDEKVVAEMIWHQYVHNQNIILHWRRDKYNQQ